MAHHIIVFGGQGRTGFEVVVQALLAGHRVTAFTHKDNGIFVPHENLKIVEGNARDRQQVSNAIIGHDIVINIVAPRLGDTKNYDISVVATKHILAGMNDNGVRRYFGQCGAWATEDMQNASLVMRMALFFFVPLKKIYVYKKQEDQLIKQSGLSYTIVRAARLTDGPLKWPIRVYPDGYKCKFYEVPKISRKSVAKFYIDNLDNVALISKCPVIIN